MVTIKLHSWDLHQQADGTVAYFIHRHDGSLLAIPMAYAQTAKADTAVRFECVDGQWSNYSGYVNASWVPQT